jgi:predicted ATPase
MITEISLQNFKIFKNKTTFPLRQLNLLTGVNGGGKSTLLQSLLLMRQSIEHDEGTTSIVFNGSCVQLGGFMDVRNSDTPMKEPIVFEISINDENNKIFKNIFHLIPSSKSDYRAVIAKFINENQPFLTTLTLGEDNKYISRIYKDGKDLNMIPYLREKYNATGYTIDLGKFLLTLNAEVNGTKINIGNLNKQYVNSIHYIAADRIGPKSYYEKTTLGKFPNVGPRGEHTANILYRLGEDLVNDRLYLGNDTKNLMQQTEEWLKKILGGAKIELKGKDREHTVLNLLFNTEDSKGRYRPSNVGFGYTYILPIIVSGLIAKSGEILIVENPEAHLHPKAQSELTKFLALVASCGVQVFIESHSEHVLNAIRVATLKNEIEISNNDVSVLYFQNDKKEPFVHLEIDEKGKIDNWVDGFFDQQELDLGEIFKLSRKKK